MVNRCVRAVAAIVVAAIPAASEAQTANPGVGVVVPGMPGVVVARSYNFTPPLPLSAGLPAATRPAAPPLAPPTLRPVDPRRPFDILQGTGYRPEQVVTPVAGYNDQSFLEKFMRQVRELVGLSTQPPPPPPNVTPGIFRRNRESLRQRLWPRD